MDDLSKDEILAILLREMELLAAEGEKEVSLAAESIDRLKNFDRSERCVGACTVQKSDCEGDREKQLPQPPALRLPSGSKRERWEALRKIVLGCEECKKHVKPGKQIVFGVGNLDAEIFFCGEAPGAEEEDQGEPFVGRAGKLLDKIIEAMGLRRADVYIGNIMNWRPEMATAYGNRPPTQDEMNFCMPYLRAQVEVVAPKVIVALGATAANGLLGYDPNRRMADVRGHWHEFLSLPTMITYHPSYLLRNASSSAKRLLWEDMLQVMERLSMAISDRQRKFFLS